MIKKLLRRLFLWLFKDEFSELNENINYIKEIVGDKEASCNVDLHYRTPSWAVINLRGKNRTYLKFIKLEDKDCVDILHYLKRFEKCDVDETPSTSHFMKAELFNSNQFD